jgi:putative ATPase
VYEDGKQGEREVLEKAISAALLKAEELRIRSLSFPAISAGICGFPRSKCAEIFANIIIRHFEGKRISSLREVRMVSNDPATVLSI